MAGSRRWFEYTSDDTTKYMVQLDETAGESSALDFLPISAATRASRRTIRVSGDPSITMRYILCFYIDGDGRPVYRKFHVGSLLALAWGTAETVTIGGQEYFITAKVGETRRLVPATDTGIIDGDVDDNDVVVP